MGLDGAELPPGGYGDAGLGSDPMRIRTAIRQYLNARADLARLTRRKAAYTLERFRDWLGPDTSVRIIKPRHLQEFLAHRLQTVVPNTARTELTILRVFFEWCYQNQMLRSNPAAGIRGPKVKVGVPREMPESVATLLSAAPDARMRVILSLMAHEGLRRAEVQAVMLEELDLPARIMLVHGKGSKDRWVPVSEPTATAIRLYLGEHPAASGPLVRSYQHPANELSADHIGKLVSRLMSETGIKERAFDGRSAHALRHTFAGAMLDNGADPRVVQAALGHDSLGSTWVYTRRRQSVAQIREYQPDYFADPDPTPTATGDLPGSGSVSPTPEPPERTLV